MGLIARMNDAEQQTLAAAAGYQPLPFLIMRIGTLSGDLFRASGSTMKSLAARYERSVAHPERIRSHTARAAIRVANQSLRTTNLMLAGSVLLAVVIAVCAVS
jgi:hypothetical protein